MNFNGIRSNINIKYEWFVKGNAIQSKSNSIQSNFELWASFERNKRMPDGSLGISIQLKTISCRLITVFLPLVKSYLEIRIHDNWCVCVFVFVCLPLSAKQQQKNNHREHKMSEWEIGEINWVEVKWHFCFVSIVCLHTTIWQSQCILSLLISLLLLLLKLLLAMLLLLLCCGCFLKQKVNVCAVIVVFVIYYIFFFSVNFSRILYIHSVWSVGRISSRLVSYLICACNNCRYICIYVMYRLNFKMRFFFCVCC